MKNTLKLVLAFAVLVAGVASIAWSGKEEVDRVKVGDQVPVYSIESEKGKVTAESLKGKVVLINFFATWCPPCVKELPHLEKEVWLPLKDNKDFQLLVVGREHTQEEINKFAEQKGLSLPFYADVKREMFGLFAAQNIPRNYIVDRNGKVIYSSTGYNEEDFKSMIEILKSELGK